MSQIKTIDEMKAQIGAAGGFANSSLYYVQLPSLGFIDVNTAKNLNLFCRQIQLPSRQLMTVNREIGPDRDEIPYGYQNTPVTMTFRVTNDSYARQYFEQWQQYILNLGNSQDRGVFDQGQYYTRFFDYFESTIKFYQLRKGFSIPVFNKNFDVSLGPINFDFDFDLDAGTEGTKIYEWTIEKAYPVMIQNDQLSDDTRGAISEVTIEFNYRRWTGQALDGKGKAGITAGFGVSTNIGEKIGNKVYNVLGG